MAQMTFLDFFSGIGGFRKGFELCGMRCVGHCEIDKYADRSYRAIHNVKEDEWYAADITKVTPADLPGADLWAAGFPCQDISVSGLQRGINGARSGLFFTLAELVKGQNPENRPTWIILEKEWSDSGDVIRFNKAQFVARGYDYRLKLTTEVYDANGKFVEDDVTYSGVESH